MQITRTTNRNGTYRYTFSNGKIITKGSKRRIEWATIYRLTQGFGSNKTGDITATLHARDDLATKGSRDLIGAGWVMIDVVHVIDGDQAPAAPTDNSAPQVVHTHTLTTGKLIPGDKLIAFGSMEVESTERDMNNLSAALVRFTDGSFQHVGFFDAHMVSRSPIRITDLPACSHQCGGPFECRTKGAFGYRCSRTQGHDGEHVACGTGTHALHAWTADTPATTPEDPFDDLTEALAQIAEQELHSVYSEDMYPNEPSVIYTCGGYRFKVWAGAAERSVYRWKNNAMDTVAKSTDATDVHRAFAMWCADRSA